MAEDGDQFGEGPSDERGEVMTKKLYAKVRWSIDDVMDHFVVTEQQAHEFLAEIEDELASEMIGAGWKLLDMLGRERGIEEVPEEDQQWRTPEDECEV